MATDRRTREQKKRQQRRVDAIRAERAREQRDAQAAVDWMRFVAIRFPASYPTTEATS